jgi:hypothetical protein
MRGTAIRLFLGAFGLGAIGCVLFTAPALPAAPPATVTLATSDRGGPIAVGPGPTRISLIGAAPANPTVRTLAQDREVYLVIAGLHAAAQPGVVYDVYLAPGTADKGSGKPELVGTINFFAASDLGNGRPAGQHPTVSLNVSDTARRLAEQGLLGAGAVVTIAPQATPAPNARPTIDSVALVAQ